VNTTETFLLEGNFSSPNESFSVINASTTDLLLGTPVLSITEEFDNNSLFGDLLISEVFEPADNLFVPVWFASIYLPTHDPSTKNKTFFSTMISFLYFSTTFAVASQH